MRRLRFALLGILIGLAFSNLPVMTESWLHLPICRESCPRWFTAVVVLFYFGMPAMWAIALVVTSGRPGKSMGAVRGGVAMLMSSLLTLGITVFGFAYQAGRL